MEVEVWVAKVVDLVAKGAVVHLEAVAMVEEAVPGAATAMERWAVMPVPGPCMEAEEEAGWAEETAR